MDLLDRLVATAVSAPTSGGLRPRPRARFAPPPADETGRADLGPDRWAIQGLAMDERSAGPEPGAPVAPQAASAAAGRLTRDPPAGVSHGEAPHQAGEDGPGRGPLAPSQPAVPPRAGGETPAGAAEPAAHAPATECAPATDDDTARAPADRTAPTAGAPRASPPTSAPAVAAPTSATASAGGGAAAGTEALITTAPVVADGPAPARAVAAEIASATDPASRPPMPAIPTPPSGELAGERGVLHRVAPPRQQPAPRHQLTLPQQLASPTGEPPEPLVVDVTIGRVEVVEDRPVPPPRPRPRLSLDDYLSGQR
jgi:hypothetical protein